MSPPMLATGNSELIDSRIQRIQVTLTTPGRFAGGNSSRHERAERSIGTIWEAAIGMSHQPMTSMALATSPAPLYAIKQMTSAKPKRPAMMNETVMVGLLSARHQTRQE